MTNNIPYLGIFWFSPRLNRLIGVKKKPINLLTIKYREEILQDALHRKEWNKLAKLDKDLYSSHYKLTPRGRILYYKDLDMYVIGVGSWIDKYPHVIDIIKQEFNLFHVNTKIVKCPHWNTGFILNWLWQLGRLPRRILSTEKIQLLNI